MSRAHQVPTPSCFLLSPFRLLSVNCVRTTNNLPSIVVVERVAVDQVRGAVKRQLGYLAQFVSVSPEMYQAVHYEKIDETTF
jgi:hypothetical protein